MHSQRYQEISSLVSFFLAHHDRWCFPIAIFGHRPMKASLALLDKDQTSTLWLKPSCKTKSRTILSIVWIFACDHLNDTNTETQRLQFLALDDCESGRRDWQLTWEDHTCYLLRTWRKKNDWHGKITSQGPQQLGWGNWHGKINWSFVGIIVMYLFFCHTYSCHLELSTSDTAN